MVAIVVLAGCAGKGKKESDIWTYSMPEGKPLVYTKAEDAVQEMEIMGQAMKMTFNKDMGFTMAAAEGEGTEAHGVSVRAVAAYNLRHTRDGRTPFHPKGDGNGYVVDLGDLRVYVGGDTEDIPEMSGIADVDVAFLPMNLPYTMTPEMVAAAARRLKPRILYPYHFGDTETSRLVELLSDRPEVEVRLRSMA